jgi:hypothetical protein
MAGANEGVGLDSKKYSPSRHLRLTIKSRGTGDRCCARAVSKPYLFSALGIALSEKQIPQVVENIEN